MICISRAKDRKQILTRKLWQKNSFTALHKHKQLQGGCIVICGVEKGWIKNERGVFSEEGKTATSMKIGQAKSPTQGPEEEHQRVGNEVW